MPLEAKDYVTFTFGAAALALSIYNFVRARLDAKALNQRTFEQKRFEAVTTAEEIKSQFAQIEGELETLRFEALRANNPSVVEAAQGHIDRANTRRSEYESIARDLRDVPSPSNNPHDLLEIEKQLGVLKAQKASASEYGKLASNFIEDGRRLMLAESLTPSPSPPPNDKSP